MSCFRKKLIRVDFREAPQPMRDNIIRQHVWRMGVYSRLRDTWFGVTALPSIVVVNLKLFQPAQGFCCGWEEHITAYLKWVILVWKCAFKGYIPNRSHHVPTEGSCAHVQFEGLHGLHFTLSLVTPLRSSCTRPWIQNPGKDLQRKYREFKL